MLKFNKPLTIGSDEWKTQPFRFFQKGEMWKLGGNGNTPSWQDIVLSGNGSLTLTQAKADGLNYVKLFGATEQRNLPSEYTQVEYLESSGTQYIDTGIILKSEATITTVGQSLTSSETSSPLSFWGFMGGSNIPRWGWAAFQGCWLTDLNATTRDIGVADVNKHTFVNTCYYDNDVLKYSSFIDDTNILTETVTSIATYTSNTLSAYLFARNNSNTAGNFSSCRIFRYEIVQDGVKVLSLVPAKRNSDNVLGMYDTVTGTFFTNAGTGAFTAGAKVTPTPDTPMDIICNNGVVKYGNISKNLFDSSAFNTDVGESIAWLHYQIPNGTYIMSTNFPPQEGQVYTNVWILAGNVTSGQDSAINGVSLGNPKTITVTDGWYTIAYRSTTPNIPRNPKDYNWQVEQGNTATPYQPYVEGIYTDGTQETVEIDTTGDTATAEMLLKVGDYKDIQSVVDGTVTRNIGIKVLDGTEDWENSRPSFYSFVLGGMEQDKGIVPFCTHFVGISTSMPFTNIDYPAIRCGWSDISDPVRNRIYIKDTSYTSIDDFKSWLASQYANGTPVIIAYPLAEPTTEQVTAQPLSIQAGTNIVEITQASIDNLGLEVSYKATV